MTIRRLLAGATIGASIALCMVVAGPAAATPTPPTGCQFIPGGLSGRWSADGSGADSAAGNNGTLTNGATFTPGRIGQAFHFDGVNDYVQVGARPSLTMGSAVTIAAWIRPTSNVDGIIVNKEGEYEIARRPNGTIQWALANPALWLGQSNWVFVNTGIVAPLNTWTHITMVYDSTKVTTYANGVAMHTVGGSVPAGNTGALGDVHPLLNDFRIGGRQGEPQHFAGDIDEVTVWNQPVSAADVTALATEGLAGERVQARPTTRIDFDTQSEGVPTTLGQTIDDEYATFGVTFALAGSGAPTIIANATFPGGVRALSPTVDGSLTPAKMQDIVLTFSVPVARVSLASGSTDEAWALRAYAGDTLVASGAPTASGSTTVATAFVTAPATTGWITRAVIDLTQATTDASGPEYFDLLQFDVADDTAPTVTVAPSPAANGAGWNNSPVTLPLSATDTGGSGLHVLSYATTGATAIATTDDADGSASLVVGDEGMTTLAYRAVDCQGNETSGNTVVQLDETPPVVTFTGNASSYTVDQDVAITCDAADALSGVASDTCVEAVGPAWSFELGTHALTAGATDVAGNEATISTTFTITVDTTTLCTLSEQFVIDPGVGHSLCAKLSAAGSARTTQARAGLIKAYRNAVAAQSGKGLPFDLAAVLDKLAAAL